MNSGSEGKNKPNQGPDTLKREVIDELVKFNGERIIFIGKQSYSVYLFLP
jgi:hypothetical protein